MKKIAINICSQGSYKILTRTTNTETLKKRKKLFRENIKLSFAISKYWMNPFFCQNIEMWKVEHYLCTRSSIWSSLIITFSLSIAGSITSWRAFTCIVWKPSSGCSIYKIVHDIIKYKNIKITFSLCNQWKVCEYLPHYG